MNFCIISPGMKHDGNTLALQSLGGSETAAIQLAEAITREKDIFGKKNRVIVFSPCEKPIEVNGVQYLPIETSQQFAQSADTDVLIVSRMHDFLHKPVKSKVAYLWCHDLALKRFEAGIRGAMYQVDRILLMSEFQKKQFKEVYGLPDTAVEVIRNGVDLSLFPKRNKYASRTKGMMVYAARPERGLENLVRPGGIMDKLAKELPDVRLMVAHYDNTVPEMKQYYEMLWNRCSQMRNVQLLGPLTKRQLYDLYSRAWLYVYPTPSKMASTFDEISCISAMEARACGLPFMASKRGALAETVAEGTGILIDGDGHDEGPQDKFVEEIKYLHKDDSLWENMSFTAYERAAELSWGPVARRLAELSDELLAERTSNPVRLYKHFYRNSDIQMCNLLDDRLDWTPAQKDMTKLEREYIQREFVFLKDSNAYREHYLKVDGYINEKQQGATVEHYATSENEPRWMVMRDWLGREGKKFKRVLDIGCWIGHQTIRAANMLPHAKVVGVDVNHMNITLAQKCTELYSTHKNVEFTVWDEMLDDGSFLGQFDLIVMNEILEHAIDPYKLIATAERLCKQGGTIFITTPFGPWEYESFSTFPYRCHVRHFEGSDLGDIFGAKRDIAIFYRHLNFGKFGEPLGHYFTIYTNDSANKTGMVNLERKIRWQSPRETLSVCMTAYNAESMLHRCLKSVAPLADEIIIAIDPKTTDTTVEIAKMYGAKIKKGVDPIIEGFEVARNNSIETAQGDWIMWIDSDEELLRPDNVAKYLRPNLLNAYAIAQHHLSVDPPMALKPDLPMRLFRNRRGLKFFGVVHEHPELELNKGVGYALIMADSWIAHDGYLTEDIRRNRFIRNIDLVVRDRQKYPERLLGKFLWLRDLIHLIRYRLEMTNGRGIDQQIMDWAREAKKLYEDNYLTNPNDPMAADAIAYYSEANRLLGLGVPVKISFAVANNEPVQVAAQFSDSDTAQTFFGNLAKRIVSQYEGRYI